MRSLITLGLTPARRARAQSYRFCRKIFGSNDRLCLPTDKPALDSTGETGVERARLASPTRPKVDRHDVVISYPGAEVIFHEVLGGHDRSSRSDGGGLPDGAEGSVSRER